MAFKHPQLFAVVAAISPAIEYHERYYGGTPLDDMYDSKEQCRQDTVPMHIHPSNQPPHVFYCIDPTDDEWYRGCDRLHEKLTALGVDDVVVAVVSSPQSTVVAGSTESVRKLVAAWEERDVMAREVAVDVASHSPQVDPILAGNCPKRTAQPGTFSGPGIVQAR